jgi:hypothetical protein
LGSITAILTGAILSPLINNYKSGLLGTSVDDQAGLTLLIIAAVLSAALYNYFLKGPILIGAALRQQCLDIDHIRIGTSSRRRPSLQPVAMAGDRRRLFVGAAVAAGRAGVTKCRIAPADRSSRNNLGFREVLSGTTFRSQAAAFAA